ncbi:MAG: outer membrane lipoprotein chaperone LolA [Nitrosomonadales bacterium]|jgi:outer membrane lipoprotein carrier protein|nr:outer membrane lipoprotein chaperone LolA [Nitrosomonadales bacterium]MBT3918092.1 outer membrane lipoprotein chaperone LolA [Nitrosomonadales bacterium]MBT4182623.1 outer membrane lipoprotein chaperone LolA [Nitrosomonadales bacterium]MBT4570636.1 outer membrane lipoprotein chaperone LolA [Nitrosomonadales bacterium]MBT4759418.1 outer membrane lipoprotein chaperone LolA [Nitrosomonadales bacterium]
MIKFLILIFFSLSASAENHNLEKILTKLNSFNADFVQTVKDSTNQLIDESVGKVLFQKPNFFRWEYKAPSENEIISDGEFLYLYDPDLKQVIVNKLDKQISMSPAMLLVSDNVHEFFNTKLISNSEDTLRYEAKPKNLENAFFKQVIFNFKYNQLKEMRVIDNFDNKTTIQFFKISQNQDINEGKFLFNYPDDIDIINN